MDATGQVNELNRVYGPLFVVRPDGFIGFQSEAAGRTRPVTGHKHRFVRCRHDTAYLRRLFGSKRTYTCKFCPTWALL